MVGWARVRYEFRNGLAQGTLGEEERDGWGYNGEGERGEAEGLGVHCVVKAVGEGT